LNICFGLTAIDTFYCINIKAISIRVGKVGGIGHIGEAEITRPIERTKIVGLIFIGCDSDLNPCIAVL